MAYFAMPYRILFHDTMAYGSQHHMVNLKLQNVARETVLFDSRLEGREAWQEELADILILTREAYSLNLAPAALGEKVAVLMTYEEPSRSTVRLCFRIVRADGEPVSCGYQTMIMADRVTQELVPAPRLLTQYLDADRADNLIEPLTDPSFAERLKTGGAAVKTLLGEEIRELGRRVANAGPEDGFPRIVGAPVAAAVAGAGGP